MKTKTQQLLDLIKENPTLKTSEYGERLGIDYVGSYISRLEKNNKITRSKENGVRVFRVNESSQTYWKEDIYHEMIEILVNDLHSATSYHDRKDIINTALKVMKETK